MKPPLKKEDDNLFLVGIVIAFIVILSLIFLYEQPADM